MRSLPLIAAVSVFLGVVVFWNLAVVAALRAFGINLPFSLPFRFFERKKGPEVLKALKGRSINTYVAISGLLLFACPLFVGLTAYDYIVRRFLEHSTYGLNYVAGSLVSFVLLGIGGVWIVLVQPEMERGCSPLVSNSTLRAGIYKVSIRPPGYPSAWLRPRRARFRFARQDHCSSTHLHSVSTSGLHVTRSPAEPRHCSCVDGRRDASGESARFAAGNVLTMPS